MRFSSTLTSEILPEGGGPRPLRVTDLAREEAVQVQDGLREDGEHS